jgi:hypothetical protein
VRLGLWPASREANPLSLKWLLERERDLKAELEPIVGEIAASYVAEFDKALKELLAKSGPLTDAELVALDKEVLALLQRAGKELGKDAGPIVGDHTGGVYTKIRETVGKKISFGRIDKAAVAWMGKDPHYWIQDYFGKAVSAKLQAIGQSALVDGVGRKELADMLRSRFADDVAGYRYWDVLSAAQLNRSRSWGVYESMVGQVEKVAWFAIGDERTCEICGALDGTVFSVQKAVNRQRKIVDQDMTPDEYKDLNPWVQTKKGEDGTEFYWKDSDGEEHDLTDEFNALTPGEADDGSDLQDIGIQAPPGHGSCRCTLNPVD